MISALITGVLFRSPEQRTSKNGRPFVTATLRVKDGEASTFIKIFAFSDSVKDELLRLVDGDAAAMQGTLKVETYLTVTGVTKISISLIAERVLALRQPPKKREPKTKPAPSAQEHDRAFDDAIPF